MFFDVVILPSYLPVPLFPVFTFSLPRKLTVKFHPIQVLFYTGLVLPLLRRPERLGVGDSLSPEKDNYVGKVTLFRSFVPLAENFNDYSFFQMIILR